MEKFRWLRYAWASPNTLVGLVLAAPTAITGGSLHVVNGVIEVQGGLAAWYLRRIVGIFLSGGASAMTLGHVVFGRDEDCLSWTRAHERVHVAQCERWGPLFIPAYLCASLLAVLSGKNPYRDNHFEREAFKCAEAHKEQGDIRGK